MPAEAIEICGIVDLDIDETGEFVTVAYLRTVPERENVSRQSDAELLALDLAL